MFRVRLIIIFFFLINVNNISYAASGSGQLKFSSNSFNNFLAYLRGDGNPSATGVMMTSGLPTGFAINQKGNNTYYYYCPKKYGDNCMPGGHIRAQNDCTKQSKKRGDGRCFVFAKGRKIVWDSANIKIPRRVTVEQIKEIFQENNWYGALPNQSSNTKKKDTKSKITKKKSTETVDIVKELKELNSLFESGVISEKEFEKAKKKILE